MGSYMANPPKGHAALRRGRVSMPGADYFLTLCTDQKRAGLLHPEITERITYELKAMQADATWRVRCSTIMPDHLHLLITLGDRLAVEKTINRLKAKTSATLATHHLTWERGFFDHRLRPDEDRAAIFHYIYLNAYRANLLTATERWPWFHCAPADEAWFTARLTENLPPPAWLA
jgi:putative transposase